MKRILFLIATLSMAVTAMCGGRWHELKVGAFASLEVVNNIRVTCKFLPDSVGYVRFFTEDEMADAVILDKSKPSRLKVMASPDFAVRTDRIPHIYVYTDILESVQSDSEKKVSVVNPAKCAKFKAVLIGNGNLEVSGINAHRVIGILATGNGKVRLSGHGEDTLLKLTGTGSIEAHDLYADKVTCHVLGGGEIYCYPKEIVLKGLGSTRVYYRGTPDKITKSGLGKLLPLE